MKSTINTNDTVLTIDQGAGSIELAFGKITGDNIELIEHRSYRLGSDELVKLYLEKNAELSRFRSALNMRIESYKPVQVEAATKIIVLGSVATNTAWIKKRENLQQHYHPSITHGTEMSVRGIDQFVNTLAAVASSDIDRVRHIVDPRNPKSDEYEIIITGLIALSLFLTKLDKDKFTVSAYGTRYGMAWMLSTKILSLESKNP